MWIWEDIKRVFGPGVEILVAGFLELGKISDVGMRDGDFVDGCSWRCLRGVGVVWGIVFFLEKSVVALVGMGNRCGGGRKAWW